MKLLKSIVLLISVFALVSCSYPAQYHAALDKNACMKKQIANEITKSRAVKIHNQFYAANVYHSGENPLWLNNRVNIHANQIPLNLLMERLMPPNTVGVQYGDGANRTKLISINYQGTLRGALDKIAAKTGYAYKIQDNMLTWSSFVTKTFDVSFMPGTSQYLMGQKEGDTMNAAVSSGSNVATGQGTNSQFSSLAANLSVWRDLNNGVKEMLSPVGKVVVSESTTTVTVRDHPENVQEVADYLASMNRDLSKEVLLEVRVFQIELNKDFNFGINWNVAYNTAAHAGFNMANLSQPVTVTPLGSNGVSAVGAGGGGVPGLSAGIIRGPFAGTNVLISALSQQGSVSNITNPEVVTLNNQVAQINISRQTTYLASSTNTLTAGSGTTATASGFSQTTLNPGVINTGFELYILPKIMNGNIYLDISSELSTLQSLQTLVVGGTTSSAAGASAIQLPVVDGKHFNLRSLVPSGSTLIVAGFNSVDSVANKADMFDIPALGGVGASQRNVQTILLITPTILGNRH